MKTIIITLAVLVLAYVAYRFYVSSNTDKGIAQLIADGAVIVDVRTEGEFEGGHIAGSINIPLSKLQSDSIDIDKDKTIITCCILGLRSVKGAEILKAKGYKNVYNGGKISDVQACVKP
jgi:rhodanese-related sulfurtransferase